MEFILMGVVVVMLGGMFFVSHKRRKKMVEEQNAMMDRLRPGMRIKNVAGTIGRIKEIREESASLKTILIETGSGKNTSFLLMDIQSVMSIMDEPSTLVATDTPQPITYDEMRAKADLPTDDFSAAEFVGKSNKKRGKK
jgi:preprotein translocase subunit YajC